MMKVHTYRVPAFPSASPKHLNAPSNRPMKQFSNHRRVTLRLVIKPLFLSLLSMGGTISSTDASEPLTRTDGSYLIDHRQWAEGESGIPWRNLQQLEWTNQA